MEPEEEINQEGKARVGTLQCCAVARFTFVEPRAPACYYACSTYYAVMDAASVIIISNFRMTKSLGFSLTLSHSELLIIHLAR